MFKLRILLLALIFSGNVYGQNDCQKALQDAKQSYDAGRFDEAVSILKPCFEGNLKGLNKVDRTQGYRLLTMSYIFSGDDKKAHDAAYKLLKTNIHYQPSTIDDPKEFVNILKSYSIYPKFCVVGLMGGNISRPHDIIHPGKYPPNVVYLSNSYKSGVIQLKV